MAGGFCLQGQLYGVRSGCLECCVEKDLKVLCHSSLVTSARSKAVKGGDDRDHVHVLETHSGCHMHRFCGDPDIRLL